MANLIITVISIALVAVAALMGAYYGGQAFMDGQTKARANELIEQGRQIASAWQLYANDHNGSYTLTDAIWTDGTASDLVPDYLAQMPKYLRANGAKSYPLVSRIQTNGYIDLNFTNSNVITIADISKAVCDKVNFLAKNVPVDSSIHWGGWSASNSPFVDINPFYCANYISGGVSTYYFLYRVF